MSKSKNVVKKLTTILFTLAIVFATGLTNVNAETTAEVNNYSDLTDKMSDNVTNVVKLTSDIKLREDLDTTFSLEMSKTLDFNGFTLTVPEHCRFKLIYRNSLDLKFINSDSSKRAKLNLLSATGYTPIYNEITQAEHTVNFEMDGIDVEYIKDLESFWQTAGDYRFNNVVFKNLKVTGFYEIADTRAYKTVRFSNVTKDNKKGRAETYLIKSSTLTVDDVIDADSIIEYSDREGTKIANRTAALGTIDAYFGPITVKKKEVQTLDATKEDELIAAVNQINNSKDTIIKLGGNIKLTKFLGFNVLGNVTLDLAGNTLDVSEHNLTFYYGYKDENNYNFRSNLTIKDSGIGNSGKIVGVGFNGRVRLSTLDMAEELKNLPKTYGFTIDGGTYAVTGTGSWDDFIFDVFSDTEPTEQNITLNVNVKKGIFEVGKVDGAIFYLPSSDESNMQANFNFETLMVKGQGVKLGFNILGKKRIEEVIPNDTKVYYTDANQVIELADRTTLVMNVRTDTSTTYPQYIKLAKKTGLSVDNVTLPNVTFGYTGVPEATINIANIGGENLEIKNISVDGSNFTIEEPSTAPTINIGATNTDYKIKAKSGLAAGNYTATITVTDNYNKTYTAIVKLKVEAKEITGLGIVGVNSKITYQETYTPALTGTTELGSGDYTIKYAKLDGGSYTDIDYKPFKVGKYKVTIIVTNENYIASDVSVFFEIVAKTITPTVNAIPDQTYTGKQITPNVSVGYGSESLTKDTDYTVEYGTNINAGEGKVTIKAISGNNYTWTDKEVTFNIVAKSLTDSNVTLNQTSFRHTGSEIKPEPVVKDGEKTLTKDVDYELSYANNTNIGNNTATVKVTGKGNYKGEIDKNFSIIDKEPQVINFDEALVTKTYGDSSFTITANHTQGNGTIKYISSNTDVATVEETTGKATIKKAGTTTIKAIASATTDYAQAEATYTLKVEKKELSYTATVSNKAFDNNKNATVSGVNFTGLVGSESLTKDTDYTVTAEFVSANVGSNIDVNVKVILKDTDKANNYNLTNANYVAKANITGKAIEESWVTVDTTTTYTYNGSNIEPVVTVKDPTGTTTLTLTKGTHYTVEYSDNLNAGTGKIKVTGIGNYAGLIEKDFIINKKSITPTIENISAETYNGSEHTPELVVKDGSTTLVKETDYTVEYTNNLRAGNAHVEITEVSSSNYTFTPVGKDFTINKYEIKASDVTLEYTSVVFDNNAKKPSVTVKMGSEVIQPIEYNVVYSNNTNVGSATVKVTIKTDSDDFTGEVTKNFEIVSKTLLTISGISDQQVTYTGSPVELVGTLQVSNGISPNSLNEKWYKGSTEISKPTNVGVYKVVYSYEDDTYMGSKTINVEITKKTSTIPSVNSYKGVVGDKLSTITLPNGFKWVDSNEEIIAGNKEYSATYTTNNDTTNYTTETTVIEVYGKSKVNLNTSVNGLGGTISSSKTNILEGTTETITFTPSTGFEISKVEVNGVDKTSTVVNNKIDVVIGNNDVSVVVTYKVIQYTITINGVANATIDPSGVIKVDYNTNKEFTIKADQGYKLVSVKVNGVERISDIVNDKLTLENILADAEVVVIAQKNVYEVTEGANQKYTITKDNEAKFKINADFRLFDAGKVYVDNELVDPKNYTAESGSTIITLKKEFVDTLSVGEHTLKVLFNDGGEAITTFNVARVTVPTDNPQTGDNIGFYIISGIISIVGLVGAGIFYRRKQTN